MGKSTIVSDLAVKILKNPEGIHNQTLLEQLKQALHTDDLNILYFLCLYQAKCSKKKRQPIWICEENQHKEGKTIVYPTAIAPKAMLAQLPIVEHQSLTQSSKDYASTAKSVTLWIKKMQAGTGTTITRGTYLSQLAGGRPERRSRIRIGAKGTDLFIHFKNNTSLSISLAEAQILQAISDAQNQKFKKIILHDLVSKETEDSISRLWEKPSLIQPSLNYDQLIDLLNQQGIIERSGQSIQALIPTLDETDQFSFNRTAPGGHGLFAFDALRAAYQDELLPKTQVSPLISSIGNGEDLSSTPDPTMVGWMVQENIPIAMITTEKTSNDLKGGQIALVYQEDGSPYVTIIEQAQAKEAGQENLFEKLGIDIKRNQQIAFFNTNMALFNYDVLRPKLKKLVAEIGESEFLKVVAPDLISNYKHQTDQDGVIRKYLQIEGAMGSCLLNLDRFWRDRYQEPLVHFINVDRQTRTRFFSPIKTAFDYFMQFHSDLFELNPKEMRLNHRRPGKIPSVTLIDSSTQDRYYQDVQTILESFSGVSLVDLKSLKIEGQISIAQAILKGTVTIQNHRTEKFDLSTYLKNHEGLVPIENGHPILQDVFIEIDECVEVFRGAPPSSTNPNRSATSGQT